MPEKRRPYDMSDDDGSSKRVRSNNGSPAPPPVPARDIEQKKQDAMARLAAVKAKMSAANHDQNRVIVPASTNSANASPTAASNGSGDEAKRAELLRKIAELRSKSSARQATPVSTPSPPPNAKSEVQKRIADARLRAQKMAAQSSNPSAVPAPAPPPRNDGLQYGRGGLGIGLHPSLLGDTKEPVDKNKPLNLKFGAAKGQTQLQKPVINPYISISEDDAAKDRPTLDDPSYDPDLATRRSAGERKSREFLFNQKGKYINQANALRQQAMVEDMRRRIALEARKAEIEEASDKAFLVPDPSSVDWWDEGLLPPSQNDYEDFEKKGRNKVDTDDSIITIYVQHPVLLAPPQDRLMPAPKPMMLTRTEQKKLRRQRRMADMKEQQAKIRLGLIEPPPPKVKKSNMMRVLGEQAVKDPTAVEARVNREIAQRKADHEQANADRALTKEQRHEKLARQQQQDAAKGVKVAVFRVDSLANGKHRYQIDINAKQNALTGTVVLHPTMNLIIVEGGDHSITSFRKLMMQRIRWQENAVPLANTNTTTFVGSQKESNNPNEQTKEQRAAGSWLNPITDGALKDLSKNRCVLVWEGEERQRLFKKWGSRVCETDGEAKDFLSRSKMENMWTLARSKFDE